MQTFYLLYKITNNIDGKHYIGVHKTTDINDSYMGSGKILKRAIKKHGVENFIKDVLAVFDTPEEMYQMESIVVDAEFVRRADTYNIKQGGNGGWDHIDNSGKNNFGYRNPDHCKRIGKLGIAALKEKCFDVEFKAKLNESLANARDIARNKYPDGIWKGKNHSDVTKKIMSDKAKLRTGDKNSSFGTCWVYNEAGNKKIKKVDLQQYLDAGYTKGRILLR